MEVDYFSMWKERYNYYKENHPEMEEVEMTEKQNRMKDAVAKLTKYIGTFDTQHGYVDYSDATFINDVLYGIGIALNEQEYQYAQGFVKFKAFLKDFLNEHEGTIN